WTPRRSDWKKILYGEKQKDGTLKRDYSSFPAQSNTPAVVEMLSPLHVDADHPGVTLSSDRLQTFARKEIPFGLWKPNSACTYPKQKKAGEFKGANRPRWMDIAKAQDDSPVYTIRPGQAVFGMICINCHGAKADSRGRQA